MTQCRLDELKDRSFINKDELSAIKADCNEITLKLYGSKECTCIDFRGEDPECYHCQAAELIDLLIEMLQKYHAVAHGDEKAA